MGYAKAHRLIDEKQQLGLTLGARGERRRHRMAQGAAQGTACGVVQHGAVGCRWWAQHSMPF